MREIILDTETTGMAAFDGDRIVEIGCVEAMHHVPTGETYHAYVNPERNMPEGAFRVHGLSAEFLSDKPVFADIAPAFLEFIADSPLVIHNAGFDMGFLNAELERLDRPHLEEARAVDTLALARRAFPGAQASLDALCRRFGIDTSRREKHGALLDAELLAEVYLQLRGGRQPGLQLAAGRARTEIEEPSPVRRAERSGRAHAPSDEELKAHAEFLESLAERAGGKPIWSE